jgi:hypothetical protein
MQQELAMLRQHLLPAERIIGTLSNAASVAVLRRPESMPGGDGAEEQRSQGGLGSLHKSARDVTRHIPVGERSPSPSQLLTDQTLDFLEEVQVRSCVLF